MPKRILRDVREATKLLILRELTRTRHTRLRTLAEILDMTVQGVSDYMRLMAKEGLVQRVGGVYRATKEGVEFLHENFLLLRNFVEASTRELSIIDVCDALAGNAIRAGDAVGLFMERGGLVAYTGKASASTGVAMHDAQVGEDVAVKDLEGIVELRPGRITILRLPSGREGGTRRVDMKAAARVQRKAKADLVGAVDATGLAMARKMGLAVDLAFAVLPAALEAAQRGVNVFLLVPEECVAEAVVAIEQVNARLEDKIAYEIAAG
jgi:putative transcriptional regulator